MPTLKDLRAAARLSQTELANASGVSLETIKKIETGKVERPHPATLRLLAAVLGQVPVVMNGSRGGPVFDQDLFENSRRDRMPYMCIIRDQRQRTEDSFVPLRQTTLRGAIAGPVAELELEQVFGYTRAECDRVLEASYRFPLPGDAAVAGVRVRFGEVVIETSLAERAEAERQYAEARAGGRQAALATRESVDVLTLQITGLQPDQDIHVVTRFVQAALAEGTGWQLRVPLTIGPRYTRGDEHGTAASRGQPLKVWRDPKHRFSLDVRIAHASSITSASHALSIAADGDAQRVQIGDQPVPGDRDVVLSWQPVQLHERAALEVITHEDLSEGTRYFLALITPPTETRALPGVDREVLLLVDRSGSMQGPKWQACRWAVRRFLAGLGPSDRFNLGLFESRCVWFEGSAVAGTEANRARALEFLNRHGTQGGTELGVALEQALRSEMSPGARARHVLLITDAQVSDESRIVQLVEQEATREQRRRISVISIDSAPRSAFVRTLAETAGGECAFLTSDPDQEDITTALDRVLDTWARPLLADVELSVETGAASVQARQAVGVTRSRMQLGDLPAGRSLWVSGAVSLFAEPVLRLEASGQVLAQHTLSLDDVEPTCPAVRTLFGARQIARLERLETQALEADARDALLDELGYANDPLRAPRSGAVYAENAQAERSVVRRLLVRESLRYGLVCAATAFVGVRVEAGQRIEASVEVPSALPAGWSDSFASGAGPNVLARAITMAPAAPAPMARLARLHDAPLASAPPAGFTRGAAKEALTLRFGGTPPADGTLAHGVANLEMRLTRLVVVVANAAALDTSIELVVSVDGRLAVRGRLQELLALGGERPLNVAVPAGSSVEIHLVLPASGWPDAAGVLEVELN